MAGSDLSVDVVVIGAGHNALIAAGYLAKAGLEVAVLEAQSIIGGNTVTEELTLAGWQHDSCSSAHAVIQSNPVLRDDELGLISRYGLRYAYTEPAAVLPLPDGDSFVLHRSAEGTAAEIARFSRKDAARFVEMVGEWNSVLKYAHRRWNAGLPIGDDAGAIAYDALRGQTAWDVVHKKFEHEVTRRVLLWMGFATFQPPTRGGTGALPVSITSGRLEFGWATPIGGSGALPAALAALIADQGGHVMVDSAVARILVSQGRAHGVETDDGRRIHARIAVVSSAHLTTLPEMLGAKAPEGLARPRLRGDREFRCSPSMRRSGKTSGTEPAASRSPPPPAGSAARTAPAVRSLVAPPVNPRWTIPGCCWSPPPRSIPTAHQAVPSRSSRVHRRTSPAVSRGTASEAATRSVCWLSPAGTSTVSMKPMCWPSFPRRPPASRVATRTTSRARATGENSCCPAASTSRAGPARHPHWSG
ncbi:MAG: phytoene desaturase family protein [Trebonia sp.]